MATIKVKSVGETSYDVTVVEGAGQTTHQVTATPSDVTRYGGGVPVERLLEESFLFLLEREPKEAILGAFDLPAIERYFPEYPREIARRLAS